MAKDNPTFRITAVPAHYDQQKLEQALKTYLAASNASARVHVRSLAPSLTEYRNPIVVSAPSGVGKGTLINKLVEKHPHLFSTTVSHTTRQPRLGEREGEAYYFVSRDEFALLVAQNAFVEFATYSGNQYGTSKQTVRDQTAKGQVVILDIDLQGAKAVKADPTLAARFVFIKPPSLQALEDRLRRRGTESEDHIQLRLSQSQRELEEIEQSPIYEACIVNDSVESAFTELEAFIFSSR